MEGYITTIDLVAPGNTSDVWCQRQQKAGETSLWPPIFEPLCDGWKNLLQPRDLRNAKSFPYFYSMITP